MEKYIQLEQVITPCTVIDVKANLCLYLARNSTNIVLRELSYFSMLTVSGKNNTKKFHWYLSWSDLNFFSFDKCDSHNDLVTESFDLL